MSSRPRRSTRVLALIALVAVLGLSACIPALDAPGDTSKITLVNTATVDGWKYEQFRNTAYPCAISGYQTFTIATKVGSSAAATRPLWVHMHGGGVGYFQPGTGKAMPSAGQKTEESATTQRGQLVGPLMDKIRTDPAGFRMLTVSMCDHDIYGGPNIPDPNNPNTTPDGKTRTVNGLYATKAAIAFTQGKYPTDDYFLHGTSAGSFGSHHVAWSLKEQGLAPTGYVADSGVLNQAWQTAQIDVPGCGRSTEALTEVSKRLHPEIVKPENQPPKLVAEGRTVPLVDVFSIGDPNQCGTDPMTCPLPNGTTATMGSVDCAHEPLRQAIAAQGPTSRSLTLRLCVSPTDQPGTCAIHTATKKSGLTNTLAPWPADYTAPIVTWVHARLADD